MTGAFPSLKNLFMSNYPQLRNVSIHTCEQLGALTPRVVEIEGEKMETSSFNVLGLLGCNTSFEVLYINYCLSMNIPINHCYDFLVELNINHSLTNFPLDLFPKLYVLFLDECHNLQMISQSHPHGHLNCLSITNCSEFESFPNEGLFAS